MMLRSNTRNRRLKPAAIAKYANDMTHGRFQLNGETIKFAASGVLLDGQNRLHAIVASGKTVDCIVVHGLDEDAQLTIDTGVKRSFGDHLQMAGEMDSKNLASVIVTTHAWEQGLRGDDLFYGGTRSRTHTYSDYEEFFHKDADALRLAALQGRCLYRYFSLPGAVFGLGFWLFAKRDVSQALRFYESLRDGTGLRAGDPILAFREATDRMNRRRHRETPRHIVVLAYLIKTWNAEVTGTQIHNLKFNLAAAGEDRSSETLPEPR